MAVVVVAELDAVPSLVPLVGATVVVLLPPSEIAVGEGSLSGSGLVDVVRTEVVAAVSSVASDVLAGTMGA